MLVLSPFSRWRTVSDTMALRGSPLILPSLAQRQWLEAGAAVSGAGGHGEGDGLQAPLGGASHATKILQYVVIDNIDDSGYIVRHDINQTDHG